MDRVSKFVQRQPTPYALIIAIQNPGTSKPPSPLNLLSCVGYKYMLDMFRLVFTFCLDEVEPKHQQSFPFKLNICMFML